MLIVDEKLDELFKELTPDYELTLTTGECVPGWISDVKTNFTNVVRIDVWNNFEIYAITKFSPCLELISGPGNVTLIGNMSCKFAGLYNFKGGNCYRWNTARVTDMSRMFEGCFHFNSKLYWDTSNVIDMSGMFYGAFDFDHKLNFDLSQVKNMKYMFSDSYIVKYALPFKLYR